MSELFSSQTTRDRDTFFCYGAGWYPIAKSDNVHPLGNLLKEELESKIHESINKLPPVCKQVFTMSRFREMSYEEISCELGISVNTVKYHIKSALVILKKELGTFLCIIFAFYPTLL